MPLVNYSFTALIDTDSDGDNIVASQAVAVRAESDAVYATIYSDSAGASPITQPGAATDSNGVLEFWVLPGYYTITSGARTETVLIDDGSRLNPLTTSDMAASKHIKVGERGIKTAEFSTGNGGGGTYDCVTVGTTANVDLPNPYNIIVSTVDATKCFVLRIEDYPKVSQLGATGAIDFNATGVFQQGLILARTYGALWVDVGFHNIQSALIATRSITILGPNKGGNGYNTTTAPNRSVILKDFDGVLLTFDGSEATATGTGGGLDGVDLVQYLGAAASTIPAHSGGAGTAIKISGTTTELRAGRLKIDNCAIEFWNNGGDTGNDWATPIDIDGSGVGGSDGVRNNWLLNMRIVCGTDSTQAVRIYNAFNTYCANVQLDSRDGTSNDKFVITGPDAAGESANVNFSNCVGHLEMDFCRTIHWSGGRIDTVSSTSDTSDAAIYPNSINAIPTALLGCSLSFMKGERAVTKSAQSIVQRFGQDPAYADTTDITGIEIGNLDDNEGAIGVLYRNGASQESIIRANFRNEADSGNANMAEHKMVKVAGQDYATHDFTVGGTSKATIETDKATVAVPFILATYTVATLPTASSFTRGLIYVSDETGGATLAFSDGTNWRRVQDRAVVS